MPWTKTATPAFELERSHRIPIFSATRWDGRLSGAVMAISRSTPRARAQVAARTRTVGRDAFSLAGRYDVVADLLRPRLRPSVEPHHVFVPEQAGHDVEVVHRHRPEAQPLRGRQFETGHGRKG